MSFNQPPLALVAGLVSRGFFLGIGLALVKQLVGVDIGFTPLAVRWPPPTTEVGAFFLLASGLHELISGVS